MTKKKPQKKPKAQRQIKAWARWYPETGFIVGMDVLGVPILYETRRDAAAYLTSRPVKVTITIED